MKTYDSLSDLLEAFDRYVSALLAKNDNVQFLIGVPRLLEFILREPRLSLARSELTEIAADRVRQYRNVENEIIKDIYAFWAKHRDIYLTAAKASEAKGNRNVFDANIAYDLFEDRVNAGSAVEFPEESLIKNDETQSGRLLGTLEQWSHWCVAPEGAADDRYERMSKTIEEIRDRQVHFFRSLWFDDRNLAGAAWRRLTYVVYWLNPDPLDDSRSPMVAGLTRWYTRPVVNLVFEGAGGSDRNRLDTEAELARQDLTLFHQDVRHNLLFKRSNLGLIKRFQARCERFDADELRDLASGPPPRAAPTRRGAAPHRQSQHEAPLTLRLARFLFDQGLDPLVDPRIAGLRPDIFVPTSTSAVYVEAKQYSNRREMNEVLGKSLRQVLDTWGRLRSTYPVNEAFVAIFRRGGPRVEIDEIIRVDGRTLYAVLIDIALPKEAGSKQRFDPVVISGDYVSKLARETHEGS